MLSSISTRFISLIRAESEFEIPRVFPRSPTALKTPRPGASINEATIFSCHPPTEDTNGASFSMNAAAVDPERNCTGCAKPISSLTKETTGRMTFAAREEEETVPEEAWLTAATVLPTENTPFTPNPTAAPIPTFFKVLSLIHSPVLTRLYANPATAPAEG